MDEIFTGIHDCEYSSGPIEEFEYPEVTEDQLAEFYAMSFSSQGFDVPDYGGSIPGGIGPFRIRDHSDEQLLTDLAKRCLQFYNDQKVVSMMNASFEFDKFVKANVQVVAGYMYYIIFNARSGDNASQTFYGEVWEKIDDTFEVEFCEMDEMDTKQEAGKSLEAGTSEEGPSVGI